MRALYPVPCLTGNPEAQAQSLAKAQALTRRSLLDYRVEPHSISLGGPRIWLVYF